MNKFDKDYLELLRYIKNNGHKKKVTRDNGDSIWTYTLPCKTISYDMSSGRFPMLTTKKVNWKCPFDEMNWMLSGSTNINDLPKRSQFIWDKWADKNGELGNVYGKQMRELTTNRVLIDSLPFINKNYQEYNYQDQYKDIYNEKILYNHYHIDTDQIKYLEHNFRNNPETRRNVLDLWNPSELHEMALEPCHFASVYNVTNNILNITVSMRSSDVPIGLPYNFCQYGMMMEIICKTYGFKKGILHFTLADAHIYEDQLEGVDKQLSREVKYELPILNVKNKKDSILDYKVDEDFEMIDYNHDSFIKFPVFV